MADNTTGLPVKSLTGEFILSKLVDTAGTNVASISAANALKVDGSAVTQPISSTAQYVGDAAATGTPTGLMAAALANATAPSDVSANNDAVALWALRNGSQVVNLASGGTLITVGQGAMAASLPVVIASNQSAITVDTELTAVAALADATANPTITNIAGYLMGYNGTTWDRVRTANTGRLQVDVITGGGGGTQYVGDAAATATPTGTVSMGLANAAAPTDVSANADAVAQWMLRNGSAVVNLASGGTLITVGQGAMAASLPVVIASNQTNLPANITQYGGTNISATAFGPARLTDGTAYYTKTGQTAGTAAYTQLSDQTNVANIIAGTNALKVDISSVRGTADAATQALSVRLTDGSAFYSAQSAGAPTDPKFSTQTSSALGAGANVTLTHYVTSGKTGQLTAADVTATVPIKIEIGTIVTGAFTTRVVAFALAGQLLQWRAPYDTFITRASADATSGFGVKITNKDASVAADVYSTGYWDEV